MKIMPVVFEVEEVESKHKYLIYELFSKVCQENDMVFLTSISKGDRVGHIVFNKDNSGKVSLITRKVNKILLDCGIEYMVSLPMIMDGVKFRVPTFHPDGEIKIFR